MHETNFDIIIIGSGPGGYIAAIRAAQLGFKTAIVERSYLGGICLNWGCIPTKALLRSAEVFRTMQRAKDFGLTIEKPGFEMPGFDMPGIVARSRAIAQRLNDGVAFLMKKNKVSIIWGVARITAPGCVTIGAPKEAAPKDTFGVGDYRAEHIIIATGARPRALHGMEPDGKLVWTYFEAMVPETLPKTLLIIGSGAISIEIASFYRALGSEVTVVEVLPQILSVEDAEIAGLARKSFEKLGITFLTGSKVISLDKTHDSVTATIETAGKTQTMTVDRVISAVGVVGNTEDLGLEAIGVTTQHHLVNGDSCNRTNIPGVYAIGDCLRCADARAQGRT